MQTIDPFQRIEIDPTLIRSISDSQERAAHFAEHGFFVVDDLYSPQDCRLAKERISAIIQGTTPNAAKADIGYEVGTDLSALSGLERELAVRKIGDNFIQYDEFFTEFTSRPSLLNALNAVREGTIRRYSDMMLLKPPGGGREKPWHQDLAYFPIRPAEAVIGCWIALDAATIENGCMHVVPGSHLQGLLSHWKPDEGEYHWEWQISNYLVESERVVPVPMPPGACLFFASTLKHGTPPNFSLERRRALQVHYIVGDYQWIDEGVGPEFPVMR